MYTICICNTARSKSIPILCTHVYSYMFSTVHPPRSTFLYLLTNKLKVLPTCMETEARVLNEEIPIQDGCY